MSYDRLLYDLMLISLNNVSFINIYGRINDELVSREFLVCIVTYFSSISTYSICIIHKFLVFNVFLNEETRPLLLSFYLEKYWYFIMYKKNYLSFRNLVPI